jgi:hypothetical protein
LWRSASLEAGRALPLHTDPDELLHLLRCGSVEKIELTQSVSAPKDVRLARGPQTTRAKVGGAFGV